MPEKSLSEIEAQIQEAEEEIQNVRGEQQLKALKKKKKKKLRKKKTEAKLKQTKTGRVISDLSNQLGSIFQQTERLDADGRNDAPDQVLIEAGTLEDSSSDKDAADELVGEVEVEGTLEFEAEDVELEGRSPDTMEPRNPTGLPPALEARETQDDEDDGEDRGIGSLPSSGF